MKHILTAALILACVSCGQSTVDTSATDATSNELSASPIGEPSSSSPYELKIDGVIVRPEVAEMDDGKLGVWHPDHRVLVSAEPVVLEYIKKNEPRIFEKLSEYKCQYYGLVADDKKRVVYNFAEADCIPEIEDIGGIEEFSWETELLTVRDGGDSFFRVVYDVEKEECVTITAYPRTGTGTSQHDFPKVFDVSYSEPVPVLG